MFLRLLRVNAASPASAQGPDGRRLCSCRPWRPCRSSRSDARARPPAKCQAGLTDQVRARYRNVVVESDRGKTSRHGGTLPVRPERQLSNLYTAGDASTYPAAARTQLKRKHALFPCDRKENMYYSRVTAGVPRRDCTRNRSNVPKQNTVPQRSRGTNDKRRVLKKKCRGMPHHFFQRPMNQLQESNASGGNRHPPTLVPASYTLTPSDLTLNVDCNGLFVQPQIVGARGRKENKSPPVRWKSVEMRHPPTHT